VEGGKYVKINRYTFWLRSLAISLFSCISLNFAYYYEFFDLPNNYFKDVDNTVAYLGGGILASILLALIYIFLHIIFLIFCKTRLKHIDIFILDFLINTKDKLFLNLIRILGYGVALFITIIYINDLCICKKFYIWGFIFFLLTLIVSIIFIDWNVSIIRGKSN
jgi:hypothetical protein